MQISSLAFTAPGKILQGGVDPSIKIVPERVLKFTYN
jgi:hypothetical protein